MRWLTCGCITLFLISCTAPEEIRLGHSGGVPGSEMADALAVTLNTEYPTSIVPFSDMNQVIAAVQNGTIDIGLIEQPQSPVDDISLVTPLFPAVLHVLVRSDIDTCQAPIDFAALLTKGKVYAGPPGSTGYSLLESLADSHWLPPLSSIDMLENPFGDQPDIFVQFGGILSVDAARRLKGYCLASLGDVNALGRGAWAEGLSYRFPHLQPYILPAGLYPNLNQQPVLTLAVTSMLVTNPEQDTDTIYNVLKHVNLAASELNAIYPLAGNTIHSDFQAQLFTIPNHPGTQRFIQRNAPTFLERYAELLAFLITVAVALSSLSVAIFRIRRQAKKDRIDEYFAQLIDYRRTIENDPVAKTVIHEQVRDLQTKVTQLVVEERIQADSAFVAFVSLSNQVLQESK